MTQRFKLPFFLGVTLFLGACAGTAEVRSVASLAIACDSYATVLDQLAPLRAQGKLSEADVSKVDAANALAAPACAPESTLDPAEAVALVKGVNAQLQAILGGN